MHRSAQKCRKSHDGHYPIHGYPAPPCKAVEHDADPNHPAFDGTRNSNASKCIFTERAESRWLLRGIWRSCSPINCFEQLYKMLEPIVFRKNRGSSLELPFKFLLMSCSERRGRPDIQIKESGRKETVLQDVANWWRRKIVWPEIRKL